MLPLGFEPMTLIYALVILNNEQGYQFLAPLGQGFYGLVGDICGYQLKGKTLGSKEVS